MIFEKIRTRLEMLIYEKSKLFNQEDRNEDKYFFQLMCLKAEVAPLINQVEAEYNNGWISVDDRLPEKFKRILVSTSEGVKVAYYDGYTFDNDESEYIDSLDAIAWMPLPKPYKKGE